MHKLSRIGVGIDFREKTDHVIESAARLARSSGAAVDLIHILRPPPIYDRVLVQVREMPDIDQALGRAREALRSLAATMSGLEVAVHAQAGIPEVEMLTQAAEIGDDMLLVGPSTRHRPGWFGVGRTAGRIVQHARLPVLVAKGTLAEKPGRIVATTDFSDASHAAVEEAIALAKLWEAELLLLHVLEPILHLQGLTAKIAGETDVYAVEPDDLEPEWQSLAERFDLEGVRYIHKVVKGEAVEAIVEAANEASADLLVVGTHGRTALTKALLGSSAEAILEDCGGPVLVVPSSSDAFST